MIEFLFSVFRFVPFIFLAYVLGDEVVLFARRKQALRQDNAETQRLCTISMHRIVERAVCCALLLLLFSFRHYPAVERLYTGAYVGFVTNALVTVLILHVFIPMLKHSIAKAARDNISALIQLEEEGNAAPNATTGILSLLGLLLPGGVVTTGIGVLLGLVTRKKVKSVIESKKKEELEKATDQIEAGIKAMSKRDVSNMMDEMIGPILILIESAGFVTGAVFGLLVGFI